MKRFIYLLFTSVIAWTSANAGTISGTVVDAASKQPLAGALVFIDGSMQFSMANNSGQFSLFDSLVSIGTLVVSLQGYQTMSYALTNQKPTLTVRFEMVKKPRSEPLAEAGEAGFEEVFLTHLFGATPNAFDAVLANPKDLSYHYDSTTNMLSVSANNMLTVLNDGLGYMVLYALDTVWINLNNNTSDLSGYCFFKHLSTNNEMLKRKWNIRRQEVYHGSLLHFMRSVYSNQLVQNGFELRKVNTILEDAKEYKKASQSDKRVRIGTKLINGQQKQFVDLPATELLSLDSVRGIYSQNLNATLFSKNALLVEWKANNSQLQPINGFAGNRQPISLLSFADTISINRAGAFIDRNNLLVQGYMRDRVADLLPFEYKEN